MRENIGEKLVSYWAHIDREPFRPAVDAILEKYVIDWNHVYAFSRKHGLTSFLFQAVNYQRKISPSREIFPEKEYANLKRNYIMTFQSNSLRNKLVGQIDETFCSWKIEAIAVKGINLLDTLYSSDIGLRPMCDIDLVLNPADLSRAVRVIENMGGKIVNNDLNEHILFTFVRENIFVELHSRLFRTRLPVDPELIARWESEFRERSQPIKKFRIIRELNKVDHLIYLVYHLVQHSLSRLIWWVDISELIKTFTRSTWQEFLRRVEGTVFSLVFFYCFLLINKKIHTRISPDIFYYLNPRGKRPRLADIFMYKAYRGESSERLNLVLYYSVQSGLREKMRFIQRIFFHFFNLTKDFLSV